MRSVQNEEKVAHLRDLCPGSLHKLELVEADLLSEEGWAAAVAGCDFVMHTASPFVIEEPDDPNSLYEPAVNGTLNVLRACAAADPLPKRVVLTSSCAAIMGGRDPKDVVFDETYWTDLSVPHGQYFTGAYERSKTMAERAAWDFVETLKKENRPCFELAVVNPSLVEGPMLSRTPCASFEVVKELLAPKTPFVPNLILPTVSP